MFSQKDLNEIATAGAEIPPPYGFIGKKHIDTLLGMYGEVKDELGSNGILTPAEAHLCNSVLNRCTALLTAMAVGAGIKLKQDNHGE